MMLQLWVLSIFFPFTKLLFESFGDEFWNKYWKSRTKDVKMCGSIGPCVAEVKDGSGCVLKFRSKGVVVEVRDNGSRILKFISVIFL